MAFVGLKGIAPIHFSMKTSFSQKVFWAWVSAGLCCQGCVMGKQGGKKGRGGKREGGGQKAGREGALEKELRDDTQIEVRESTKQTVKGHLQWRWGHLAGLWRLLPPHPQPQRQTLTSVPASHSSSTCSGLTLSNHMLALVCKYKQDRRAYLHCLTKVNSPAHARCLPSPPRSGCWQKVCVETFFGDYFLLAILLDSDGFS